MARNRFNHLFIEGHSGRPFYRQALGHEVTPAEARRFDRTIIAAAKRRGLIFEHMGHGWTAWSLGFPPDAPRPTAKTLALDKRPLAAELNGVRELYMGSPGNTHLCLSTAAAREAMSDLMCEYAAQHPEVDILSIWMADGFNNWCECSRCAKIHPSDLWVRLINRLAKQLHSVQPAMRLEVLGYCNLMEPPPGGQIDNGHGNVVFMYAPFIRCYLHPLHDASCTEHRALHRFPPANWLHYPMNDKYAEFFAGWRDKFRGTNYVFDYYNWLPIKRVIFEGNVPETIFRDLTSYPYHGIDGCVDCSRAQSFWPTPLARWMQGRASWDAAIDYETERHRLLILVFGEHAKIVEDYLHLTYDCLLPDQHGREEERTFDPRKVRRYRSHLPAVRTALDKAIAVACGRQGKFLRRVAMHADFTLMHLDCLLAEGAGRYDEAAILAEEMYQLATRHAELLAGAADPPELQWLRDDTLERLRAKKAGSFERIG
jgi:hypothetical protein